MVIISSEITTKVKSIEELFLANKLACYLTSEYSLKEYDKKSTLVITTHGICLILKEKKERPPSKSQTQHPDNFEQVWICCVGQCGSVDKDGVITGFQKKFFTTSMGNSTKYLCDAHSITSKKQQH